MFKSIWFWIFIIWLIIGLWLCRLLICSPAVAGAADACNDWEVRDQKKEIFDIKRNVNFKRSSYKHLTGISSVNNAMTKLASYLKESKKGITVTGYYDSGENNPHPLAPNLGVARANDVKSWLTKLGVPANQIATKSLTDCKCFEGDTLSRGVEFSIGAITTDKNRLAAIKNRLFGKPLKLYFETNSPTPKISAQQRQDFSDLFYYLENVGTAKLDVDGHTDNVGNQQSNITLSQQRANDVKSYIMRNSGITTGRMDTQGFGPNNPIAPNDTPANMALNRRVEVTLK